MFTYPLFLLSTSDFLRQEKRLTPIFHKGNTQDMVAKMKSSALREEFVGGE